jgi:hypothetical protein
MSPMHSEKTTSFLQTVQFNRPELVFLVRGKDVSGQHAWYYVLVDRNKRDVFAARNGAASVDLSDYGRILYSGFGENPPRETKDIMARDYGFKE